MNCPREFDYLILVVCVSINKNNKTLHITVVRCYRTLVMSGLSSVRWKLICDQLLDPKADISRRSTTGVSQQLSHDPLNQS